MEALEKKFENHWIVCVQIPCVDKDIKEEQIMFYAFKS